MIKILFIPAGEVSDKFVLFIDGHGFTFWVDQENNAPYNKDFWQPHEYDTMLRCLPDCRVATLSELLRRVNDWPGFANLDY